MSSAAEEEEEEVGGGEGEEGERRGGAIEVDGGVDSAIGWGREQAWPGRQGREQAWPGEAPRISPKVLVWKAAWAKADCLY